MILLDLVMPGKDGRERSSTCALDPLTSRHPGRDLHRASTSTPQETQALARARFGHPVEAKPDADHRAGRRAAGAGTRNDHSRHAQKEAFDGY